MSLRIINDQIILSEIALFDVYVVIEAPFTNMD